MKNKDLIALLQTLDPEKEVRYVYDTGHSYPLIVRAYEMELEYYPEHGRFICLDENPERS